MLFYICFSLLVIVKFCFISDLKSLFACFNYGAMTHNAKSCMERPQKIGAKWTNMHIAPDEKIESFELDYNGKRDRWNGFDAATYARVIER